MLVPPIVPLTLWCTARRRGDVALGARAIAVARVVVIGVVYVTLLKAIAGRQHPRTWTRIWASPACARTWGACKSPRVSPAARTHTL